MVDTCHANDTPRARARPHAPSRSTADVSHAPALASHPPSAPPAPPQDRPVTRRRPSPRPAAASHAPPPSHEVSPRCHAKRRAARSSSCSSSFAATTNSSRRGAGVASRWSPSLRTFGGFCTSTPLIVCRPVDILRTHCPFAGYLRRVPVPRSCRTRLFSSGSSLPHAMPRCTSPQPYTGSSGSNYGSLHYPPPQSDDRLRRLMLHDVSAPAESAVATDAFSVAAVSTSDGMSVILTGATARPKATHGSSYYGPASAATEARRCGACAFCRPRSARRSSPRSPSRRPRPIMAIASPSPPSRRRRRRAGAAGLAPQRRPRRGRRVLLVERDEGGSDGRAGERRRRPRAGGCGARVRSGRGRERDGGRGRGRGPRVPGRPGAAAAALAAVRDDDDDGVGPRPPSASALVTRLRAREIA